MANLRDIINAATPGPWEDLTHVLTDHIYIVRNEEYIHYVAEAFKEADARHIAAYSPDHALLIEAVIEAAEDVHESLEIGNRFFDAVWNLRQYRKERGYE